MPRSQAIYIRKKDEQTEKSKRKDMPTGNPMRSCPTPTRPTNQ